MERIISMACYSLAQVLLLWYLLFRDKAFLTEVVLECGELLDDGDCEKDKKSDSDLLTTQAEPRCFSEHIRWIMLVIGGVLAAAAGYFVSREDFGIFELIKLEAALLGVSSCAITDHYIYRIPNRFIYIMCIARVVIFLAELVAGREDLLISGANSLIGGAVSFLGVLLLSLITKQGIGMGDVKLIGAIGFLGGLYVSANTLLYSLILCTVVGLYYLCRKKKTIKDKLPFGPFLYGGYIITLMLRAV